MVSTHSQYITDFTPKTMEPGKSPLALLAKTCETIGLPDTPLKKSSPVEKKDQHHEKRVESKAKASPRSTPASKEPTLTFPGLPKPTFPTMGMPMPFPFFNPMMPYPMPFPAFPMAAPGFPMGAPAFAPTSSASSFTPEMMAQFATHPLFSAYAGMMPSVSGSSPMPSYQSLLAASAAAVAASTPTTSTTSTSTKTTTTASSTPKTPTTSAKHRCNWMESNGVCGKVFNDEEELANHVKSVHTPSPPSSASSTDQAATSSMKTPTSRPASSASQVRFNPYSKPATSSASTPSATTPLIPQLPMNPMMLPFPLQAMYAQRLMPTIPHP